MTTSTFEISPEMTNALSSTTTMMTNLLLAVACISLIVGGRRDNEYYAGIRYRADT